MYNAERRTFNIGRCMYNVERLFNIGRYMYNAERLFIFVEAWLVKWNCLQ